MDSIEDKGSLEQESLRPRNCGLEPDDDVERYYEMEPISPAGGVMQIMGADNITGKHHWLPLIYSLEAGMAVVDYMLKKGRISRKQASSMRDTLKKSTRQANWTAEEKKNFATLYKEYSE